MATARDKTRLAPPPFPRAPVLLNDCVTPFDGSTLLAALLKRDLDDQEAKNANGSGLY